VGCSIGVSPVQSGQARRLTYGQQYTPSKLMTQTTRWHPAFLALGKTLEECAAKYRGFCKKYKPQSKPEKRYNWGSQMLPKMGKGKGKKKSSPGQMKLPWDNWEVTDSDVREVAEKFVMANCYDPYIAAQFFDDDYNLGQ
jgi:putative transposase